MCYAFSEQVVSIGQLFTTFPANSTRHIGPGGGETYLGRDMRPYLFEFSAQILRVKPPQGQSGPPRLALRQCGGSFTAVAAWCMYPWSSSRVDTAGAHLSVLAGHLSVWRGFKVNVRYAYSANRPRPPWTEPTAPLDGPAEAQRGAESANLAAACRHPSSGWFRREPGRQSQPDGEDGGCGEGFHRHRHDEQRRQASEF